MSTRKQCLDAIAVLAEASTGLAKTLDDIKAMMAAGGSVEEIAPLVIRQCELQLNNQRLVLEAVQLLVSGAAGRKSEAA